MIFRAAPLAGVFVVSPEPIADHRGSFARCYAADLFARQGLTVPLPLTARAHSARTGTLRGLHFQVAPHEETKLVSCARGSVFDVVVDLRPGSATRGRWYGARLDERAASAMYVPAGCAHGYVTLEDDTVVLYQMTDTHRPDAERGLRWDDPALAIAWPVTPRIFSDRDRAWPWLPSER